MRCYGERPGFWGLAAFCARGPRSGARERVLAADRRVVLAGFGANTSLMDAAVAADNCLGLSLWRRWLAGHLPAILAIPAAPHGGRHLLRRVRHPSRREFP